MSPRCESCGGTAQVRLRDDSTWCLPCHNGALSLGYDTDTGTMIGDETVTALDLPSVSWPVLCAVAADESFSDADLGCAFRLFLGGFALRDGQLHHDRAAADR